MNPKQVGRYIIDSVIGKSNSGRVYRAFQKDTQKIVAIKEVRLDRVDPNLKSKTSEMAQKEARLLLKLNHPNIVRLLNFYEDESHYYLVLEFCPHGNLEDFISNNFPENKVPEHEARRFAQQIFAGVRIMYENKIVHRDIRLENILLGEDYTAKLSDFGFGRFLEAGIMSTITGSVSTMAPEIRRGVNYDEKCDIWSLGLVLYRMLFGGLPFADSVQSRGDILKLVSNPNWLDFPWRPPTSDAIKSLISNMLKSDPKERISYKELFEHPWITGVAEIPRNFDLGNRSFEISGLKKIFTNAGF